MRPDLLPPLMRCEQDARSIASDLLAVTVSLQPFAGTPNTPKPLTIDTVIRAGALARELELIYATQESRKI